MLTAIALLQHLAKPFLCTERAPLRAMDRSRSPRNLSDEARFLQRLAEPELPPGASDAERAAARAEAAAGVEHAANELGEHWARAYQELRPDWQPTPTGIEVSNQRAAELTAAREQIARLTASISVLRTHITRLEAGITAARDELCHGIHEARAEFDRVGSQFGINAYFAARNSMVDAHNGLARLQPATAQQPVTLQQPVTPQPFTGQGHSLDE